MKGDLRRHADFGSEFVDSRHVEVLLPPGYDGFDTAYPVLYMQDGQNLFEPKHSFAGVTWGVQETMRRLTDEEGLAGAIVVGIWNSKHRISEYMPQRPMEEWADPRALKRFEATYGGKPSSDAYLRFIVQELKPFIDKTYRTLHGRDHTWLMGSSMGGLVSLYAICEHPEVFSGAACLSTSWTVGSRVMLRYLERRLPKAGHVRLYFDYGVEAQIARYEALQNSVNRLMQRSGYTREGDWMTRRFPGAAHDEAAWKLRLDVPVRFLLQGRNSD
ncbi:MAG: putative alpha/beta superfamily hydrolase [Rhodothermales bacterium]|jgi:predicted alpha/beta superfamily hydrolase